MTLELVKDPHLAQLRAEVKRLQGIVDAEPSVAAVSGAWTSLDKIKMALSQLCPNHPEVWVHRSAPRVGA
jgi:hypothetical protein